MKNKVFYKENPQDKIWWVDTGDVKGVFEFSFDKKKTYNLFADYPHNMDPEEIRIFDNEQPYWAEFFADRKRRNNHATG